MKGAVTQKDLTNSLFPGKQSLGTFDWSLRNSVSKPSLGTREQHSTDREGGEVVNDLQISLLQSPLEPIDPEELFWCRIRFHQDSYQPVTIGLGELSRAGDLDNQLGKTVGQQLKVKQVIDCWLKLIRRHNHSVGNWASRRK